MSPSPLASQLTVVNSLSPTLSTRGTRALGRPPLLKCALFENQFCLRTNENGVINLGVAENVSHSPVPYLSSSLFGKPHLNAM